MNYIKKISSANNFYYIKLPRRTSKVYLDINLKSGYAEENDKEFGVGHLLEHYLIGLLRLKGGKYIKIAGSIGQESTIYSLDSSVSKIIDEAQVFINAILKPEFSDKQLFQLEKEALINELYIKLNSSSVVIKEAILVQRVNKKCRYARNTNTQIKNIRKIKLEDLKRYHHKFFVRENIVITIGGYQLKPQIIQKTFSFIKECKLSTKRADYSSPKCSYSKFKIKTIKKDIRKGLSTVVLTFPAYDNKINPAQRIILDVLGWLLSDSPDGLLNQLRQLGIYSSNYGKIVWRNMGMIYFFSSITNQKLLPFLGLMNETIKELKNKEIPKTKLKIFLNQIKQSEKKAFNNNLDRLDWINYDLVHYGRVFSIKEDLKIIEEITTKTLKTTARNILRKNKANIIIIGKNIKGIDKNKITRILNF
ncbi:MAG: M16 family metallopeptidase [Candidatus Paceibacterota bacterium]|jgi:predicted Zn-dependent peptidase